MRREACWLGAVLLFAAVAFFPPAARSETVDLALVLAVDVSGSIDGEEYQVQHEGYAAAFASDRVVEAIRSGEYRAIAVTYVEWSGAGNQRQLVPWTVIRDKESAAAFAAAVKGAPRVYSDWTSISGALDYCAGLFAQSGVDAQRRVIDISGDGVNNAGRGVTEARDAAVAQGIVINGLPILNEDPKLESYYEENVIGGAGAFKVPVKDFSTFADALMGKLVREIVALPPPRATSLAALP